ncbi:MAG: helix-turn-helix transcriptional regulator [Acidobacteriota bacterium]
MIAVELERLLVASRIRQVHIADGTVPPPILAYVTPFPRLSIPLEGVQAFELARHGHRDVISAGRGHVVLVPAHAWDRPQWSNQATVLTCLFGHKQIGFSLVQHGGKTDPPQSALKTSVHGAHDGVSRNILQALMASAMDGPDDRLNLLLVESLLHACVRLLTHVERHPHRKATLTYEAICLYVAEHFQNRQLNRESVAERFGLAPNHISRLFAVEGSSRFNDHLNIVRVNRAKFMLQNYRMSVKEIAANSGYSDAAYFCRVFRKVTGVTPLQYRTGDH